MRYVALLRAISNVPMQPFRAALVELGFTDVESYGTSGNLLFSARSANPDALELRIGERLGLTVFVRTRAELGRVVSHDPFMRGARQRARTGVMFLARSPTAARRRAFAALAFVSPRPVLRGRTVYFTWPTRLRGNQTNVDLERELGVAGTFRSSRVVRQLLGRMAA